MSDVQESPAHILVVDDDRRIRELLRSYLVQHGFRVSMAGTASEARERMRGMEFDLIVLDVMMPGETGNELAASLRAERSGVPILILSALADPADRIKGLMSGGDDYLAKPFDPQELLLRIQSVLRRAAPREMQPETVRFGDCTFSPLRGELRREGESVRLTTRERDLLRLLAKRAGEAVSRTELAQPGGEESLRSVDVQINRLRQKIEADPANPIYLQTVRGAGYTLHVD
ncbi:MAG: response regulator transcription factor [Rhizobiales bacterium]|nr:response regulator transcription factor [Hyphomicrobiales bacterium]